jgi:hypothetical protein
VRDLDAEPRQRLGEDTAWQTLRKWHGVGGTRTSK